MIGRSDESLEQIERAVALDPMSPVMRVQLGGILESKGRFLDAEKAYRKAMTIDPLLPGSYLSLSGLTAYALGRPADGVPFARKAMALDPGGPSGVVTLAILLDDLGNGPEARRLAADAVRRWPDGRSVQTQAAVLQAIAGEWKSAAQSAQRALALDPREQGAVLVLAVADRVNGDLGAARAHYAKAYPELLAPEPPSIDDSNFFITPDLASILLQTGEDARARQLLDGCERVVRRLPRLGQFGYGIVDAQIHALRGNKAKALAALRAAEQAGWRGPVWRYYRDFDYTLASIRDEPEFRAVFADIERDMALKRAKLAKLPKDAPLDLAAGN